MRIGLFTESYDPVINGVSTSVKTLAAQVAMANHEAVIVAPDYPGFTDERDDLPPHVSVRRLPSWRTILNPENPFAFPPIPLLPLPAAYRDLSLDLIHTQQPFGIGLHGRVAARRFGIPLVSTFHTLYSEYAHYAPFLPRRVAQAIVARHLVGYYNSCSAVVVPSRAAGKVLEGIGINPQRIQVVPTGVPSAPTVLPAAKERVRETYSLPPYAPVLLYVGRLAREKSLDLLLNAFARLSATHPVHSPETHPILLMVGSGPYRETCERMARERGIELYVRFAGFLSRQQLAPIYAAVTLFVFPSATETQGVVLSEAQSHGLPCVVVRGGGSPEFVRDGEDAIIVEPGDVEAFVAAIRFLLQDEAKRRQFALSAMNSPLRPTPEAMVQQMLALYTHLIGGRDGQNRQGNPLTLWTDSPSQGEQR